MTDVSGQVTQRGQQWAATMDGFRGDRDAVTVAHRDSFAVVTTKVPSAPNAHLRREAREETLDRLMADEATRGTSPSYQPSK